MKQLEQELETLRMRVVEMGKLTESMVWQAIDAVAKVDTDAIEPVLTSEDEVDRMQLEIDQEAIRVMTIYSPVAGDLRFVLSVSRITAELERIGDCATNICESLQLMTTHTEARPISEIIKMGDVVKKMVCDAMRAFSHGDEKRAMSTIACDDLVDALNDQIVKGILQDDVVREAIEGQRNISGDLSQILIASALERIADQATNISEEVVYMVKGSDIRHSG